MQKDDLKAYTIYAIIFAIVITTASSCATFNRIVTNDALVSQLAVEAATARVLTEHPHWKTATVGITDSAIQAIDSKVTADLASIEAYVKDRINWTRMLPEEQALVSVLITQTRMNLEDSFRARGVLVPAEQVVAVRQVLEWINETAKRQ